MSGPYFETWTHENLVKFAKEAYEKLQRQEEELQRLRCKTRPATREEKIVRPGVYEMPTPPRREWVGLTLEEIFDCTAHITRIQKDDWLATDSDLAEFAHVIEAKLKEKNA